MIQAEYQRFLQTLLASPSSTSVHKFANLVLAHLNTLVPLWTHQGQRVKYVSTLAQKECGVLRINKGAQPKLKLLHTGLN